MSQSSGLLSEEDLRVNLNEYLNTNLERDSLSKPTHDMLVDIYSKFLDSTKIKWRGDEVPIEAYIIPLMNKLIKPQDPPYKFLITDLIAPIRKRTSYFLNFIVYVKAHYSELSRIETNYLQERASNELRSEQLKAEVDKKRQALEDLALKRSSLPSKEELIERIETGRKKLMHLENLGEKFKQEGKSIKEQAKISKERLIKSKEEKVLLISNKTCIDNAKVLSDKIPELEDQLKRSKLEHEQFLIDKRRNHDKESSLLEIEYSCRLAQLRSEHNALPQPFLYENELMKEKMLRDKHLQELDNEIRTIEENTAKEVDYQKDLMKSSADYIARLKKESRLMDEEILTKLTFMQPKLEETIDVPADRTYIKK